MVGKVREFSCTTGNLTSPHAPELKFPVVAETNKGLSRQPAQVAPPQLQGGGRAEEDTGECADQFRVEIGL